MEITRKYNIYNDHFNFYVKEYVLTEDRKTVTIVFNGKKISLHGKFTIIEYRTTAELVDVLF